MYGPPGIDEVVRGFEIAYAADRRLRQLDGGGGLDAQWAIPQVKVIEVATDAAVPVLERDRLRILAFRTDHGPVEPSLGYRIELADRSAVFNGDARADASTIRHARGADLLVNATIPFQWALGTERIARVIARTDPGFPDASRVNGLFSTPLEIARVARSAEVGTLVYSHTIALPPFTDWLALWGVSSTFDGEVHLGKEGMRFDFETRR